MKKTLTQAIEEAKKNPKDPNTIIFYPFTHYPLEYKPLHPPKKQTNTNK